MNPWIFVSNEEEKSQRLIYFNRFKIYLIVKFDLFTAKYDDIEIIYVLFASTCISSEDSMMIDMIDRWSKIFLSIVCSQNKKNLKYFRFVLLSKIKKITHPDWIVIVNSHKNWTSRQKIIMTIYKRFFELWKSIISSICGIARFENIHFKCEILKDQKIQIADSDWWNLSK